MLVGESEHFARRVLVVWTLATSLSCVSTTPSAPVQTLKPSESRSPWTGHTQQELVDVWGQPSKTEPDGTGGSLLVYERDRMMQYGITGDPVGPNGDAPMIDDDSFNRRVVARFWVDRAGKISRVWIDERLWKGGYPLPGKLSRWDTD